MGNGNGNQDGATGPTGPTGPTGATGATGATGPLTDADTYESASGASNTTPGTKYYQISVPDYSLVGASSATGATGAGNSFVQIGSFPTQIPSANQPAGFAYSLSLANLVGDAALITAVEGSGPNIDSVPGGFSDGSGLPQPYDGKGDPTYLLGFADDTRIRGVSDDGTMTVNTAAPQTLSRGQTVANTAAARQQETLRLLTKGGWWDHSDGNRVTTTSGDKIEVIQGNYKLVVLGRQALPPNPRTGASDTHYSNLVDNAFITDVSGGHFQEQYPSPTPCIKTIEYTQEANGEWTLYQDNSIGNLITKLKGRTVDLFQGSKREVYVGTSSSSNTDSTTGICLDPELVTVTWAQKVLSQTGSKDKPVGWANGGYVTSSSDAKKVAYGDSIDASNLEDGFLNGDVVAKTWAQRVRTYVGSVDQPIVHVYSETYAKEIQNYTFAESHVNTTMGVHAVSVTGVLNTVEIVMGIKESVQVGASMTFKLAADLTVGLTRTSFHGNSTTLDGGKVVATVTQDELSGIKNVLIGNKLDLSAANTTVSDVFTWTTTTTNHITGVSTTTGINIFE